MNFHLKVILAVVVIVLLALVTIFFFAGGEEARVQVTLEEAFDAARQGNADGVIAHISPNFNDGASGYDGACEIIRRYVGPNRYRDLELKDLEVSVFGDSASAKCRVRIIQPSDAPGVPFFDRRLKLELRKEEGRWWVTSADSPSLMPVR